MLSRSVTYAVLGQGPNTIYSYYVMFCRLFLAYSSAVESSRMTSGVYVIHTVTLKKRNSNNIILYQAYRRLCLVWCIFQIPTSLHFEPRPFLKGRALAQSARKELLATRSTKNPNPTSWVGPTTFLRPGSSPRPPMIITGAPAVVCQRSFFNHGVQCFDSQLTMGDHMRATCRSCFFQLRQLRAIRSSLMTDAGKTLAQAFVRSRLDYCNSLLYGVSEDLLRRLQSVQNAAARFITGARKYNCFSPVLHDLHWSPL